MTAPLRIIVLFVEPYEFELPGGRTTSEGWILETGTWPPGRMCAIVRLDEAISWAGAFGSHLLVRPRYSGDDLEVLARVGELTVNADLIPDSIFGLDSAIYLRFGRDFPGKLYGGPLPSFIAVLKLPGRDTAPEKRA